MMKDVNFQTSICKKQLKLFTLSNKNNVKIHLTNFGAKVIAIFTPDKKGDFNDIVLGYDTLEEYQKGQPFYGATVGRYAGRIANGKLPIEGNIHQLAVNNDTNHLHGGPNGFHNQIWEAKIESSSLGESIKLTYFSKDSEENYPGNLNVKVTYTLSDDNELIIEYEATTDKTTVVNLTHHSYFNLEGAGNPSVLNHILKINADKFLPLDKHQIPKGNYKSVTNTPFDFRTPTSIEARIHQKNKQLKRGFGYDHTWVLPKEDEKVVLAAVAIAPNSKRKMEVWTDQPGIVFYTGNFLEGEIGKNGKTYPKRSAFCLETQHFSNSPNQDNFPTTLLKPNEKYTHTCIYKFSVDV